MALKYSKISEARIDLANIVNSAYFQGQVTIITIGKTERAAIVPLSRVPELAAARDYIPPVPDEPRTELPSKVDDAHSSPDFAAIAAAFELPPDYDEINDSVDPDDYVEEPS